MLSFTYKNIRSRLRKMQDIFFFAKAAARRNFIVSNYSVNSSQFYVVIPGQQNGLSGMQDALPWHFPEWKLPANILSLDMSFALFQMSLKAHAQKQKEVLCMFLLFPLGIIGSYGKTAHLRKKNRVEKGTLKTKEVFGDHVLNSTMWVLTKQRVARQHTTSSCVGLYPHTGDTNSLK